jgi:hypothetical protein
MTDAEVKARDEVAARYREAARQSGGDISFADAQKRVDDAKRRGDAKRAAGNR